MESLIHLLTIVLCIGNKIFIENICSTSFSHCIQHQRWFSFGLLFSLWFLAIVNTVIIIIIWHFIGWLWYKAIVIVLDGGSGGGGGTISYHSYCLLDLDLFIQFSVCWAALLFFFLTSRSADDRLMNRKIEKKKKN